jgi:RNA polymerase-binding transcription factor DksA
MLRGADGAASRPDTLGQMAEPELAELREIHAALERIERGIFGQCEDCQAAIEESRLELVPWERRCAPCRGAEVLVEHGTQATA